MIVSGRTQGSAPTTIFAINFPDAIMQGEIEGAMDSGLEERILPSIRRPQMLLIYRNGGVANPETFGQIACSVGRPARSERWG